MVTEATTPLEAHLREAPPGTEAKRDDYYALGLREIATAVSFLNNDCKLVHGGVSLAAVVVTERLDWKLHGFDLCSELESIGHGVNGDAKLIRGAFLVPDQYKPEEYRRGDWVSIPEGPPWAITAWGLGCLIQEVYSGGRLRGTDQLREIDHIPKSLLKDYQRLLGSQPTRRYNPKSSSRTRRCFRINSWRQSRSSTTWRSRIPSKRNASLGTCRASWSNSTKRRFRRRFYPCSRRLVLQPSAAPRPLPMLIAAEGISREKYQQIVIPTVMKLYESQDKVFRLDLLEHLNKYAVVRTRRWTSRSTNA